ncbi:YdeI/OmpD-associated family protein [Pedobacter paludis]|uniref:YdeI/OmpD-associated family protein n=1 Tax=Pedobacter paludis TaxID=2203212 RepID=UPI001F0CAFE7|nr:YdeI/OmpD-associated family protein [Pedobacter paludis]
MIIKEKDIETFCPTSRQDWRNWLLENHHSKPAVWLVQYKKKCAKPSISWSDAVDEALCFGWIDSIRKTLDEERFVQFFSKRKPNGTWSKVNKAKIIQLIKEELMMPAGFYSIEKAKQNGSWTLLDDVEELLIPKDLEEEFKTKDESKAFFLSLSKSVRKAMLQWIALAKRPETRKNRISEIVKQSAQRLKPKQF